MECDTPVTFCLTSLWVLMSIIWWICRRGGMTCAREADVSKRYIKWFRIVSFRQQQCSPCWRDRIRCNIPLRCQLLSKYRLSHDYLARPGRFRRILVKEWWISGWEHVEYFVATQLQHHALIEVIVQLGHYTSSPTPPLLRHHYFLRSLEGQLPNCLLQEVFTSSVMGRKPLSY